MTEAASESPAKGRRARKPVPKGPAAVGPTDISDPLLRHEAKRAFVWIGMVGLAALVVVLAQPLLVIFGGMVFAAMDRQHPAEQPCTAIDHRGKDHPAEDYQQGLGQHHDQRRQPDHADPDKGTLGLMPQQRV
ncbi:MAG: hypothetical protein ACK5B7_06650, partial [Novosphingobium sp.]